MRIDPGAVIHPEARIDCDIFCAGKGAQIGRCEIVAHVVHIGENTRIADDVVIDVSGGKTKRSTFRCGPDCLLARWVYINACQPVVLGEHACLSPRAMVFTHRYWQSVMEGYSAAFRGVTIGDDAWIGAGSQVMAGVSVGAGSILMAGSVAIQNIPDRELWGGVPATRRAPAGEQVRSGGWLEDIYLKMVQHADYQFGTSVHVSLNREHEAIYLSGKKGLGIFLYPGSPTQIRIMPKPDTMDVHQLHVLDMVRDVVRRFGIRKVEVCSE